MSLLLLDLEDFKAVNDTYGHPAGDKVLVDFAQTLRQNARCYDVLARLGGDEFAILLPDASVEEATVAAKRHRNAVREACLGGLAPELTSVSIGLSHAQEGTSDTVDELFARADAALYAAKAARHGSTSGGAERRLASMGAHAPGAPGDLP